jgi:hypothetical protein
MSPSLERKRQNFCVRAFGLISVDSRVLDLLKFRHAWMLRSPPLLRAGFILPVSSLISDTDNAFHDLPYVDNTDAVHQQAQLISRSRQLARNSNASGIQMSGDFSPTLTSEGTTYRFCELQPFFYSLHECIIRRRQSFMTPNDEVVEGALRFENPDRLATFVTL